MKCNISEIQKSATDLLGCIDKLKVLLPRLEAENKELRERLDKLEQSNAKLNEDMTNILEALASGKIN